MRVPQCINNYLCECKCTFPIDFVRELIEDVKERHQVTGNTKTI